MHGPLCALLDGLLFGTVGLHSEAVITHNIRVTPLDALLTAALICCITGHDHCFQTLDSPCRSCWALVTQSWLQPVID